MKKALLLITLLSMQTILLGDATVDIHKQVGGAYSRTMPKGDGPAILLLQGGRPWVANDTATNLNSTGAKCLVLTSAWLNGFGGSPIRPLLNDSNEPEPFDGITPAWAELSSFKAVVIFGMSEKNQRGILTEERMVELQRYVEAGGGLVLGINAPSALGDLLPVTYGKMNKLEKGLSVRRIAKGALEKLPEVFPVVENWRSVELRDGSEALATIHNSDGSAAGIFIARLRIGNGCVVWINLDYERHEGVVQNYSWAWSKAMLAALVNEAGALNLNVMGAVRLAPPQPPHENLESVSVTVDMPTERLDDIQGEVSVEGNTAIMPDGTKLSQNHDGSIDVFWTGNDNPSMRLAPPVLHSNSKALVYSSETSEAVDVKRFGSKIALDWKSDGIVGSKTAVFSYVAFGGAKCSYEFKVALLELDKRTYRSLASRLTLSGSPVLISSIEFPKTLLFGAKKSRRMACYAPPRGYAEFDLTGKANTSDVRFFGGAQPFGYIAADNGVFIEFLEGAEVTSIQYVSDGKSVNAVSRTIMGRVRPPRTTQWLHHAWSEHPEDGANDYLAIWHFARRQLRRQTGLNEYSPAPLASYLNTCSQKEKIEAITTAKDLGFRFFQLEYCPIRIEGLAGKSCLEDYDACHAAGIKALPWTPCDYGQGDGDTIFKEHPEWYLRTENGEIMRYFKQHPVFNLGNPDYRKWYFDTLAPLPEHGVGYLYMDMGGAAADNVDWSTKEAEIGLVHLIELFRGWHKRGVCISIEGMNALVVDNYWYRQKLYQPFTGKEFALYGQQIRTNLGDEQAIDWFRAAMHCAFTMTLVDGYAANFERTVGELANVKRISSFLPAVNAALDLTGVPFVRETPFGTSWVGENGGALFFWHGAKSVDVTLPKGWRIRGSSTSHLENVPPESIILIDKQ